MSLYTVVSRGVAGRLGPRSIEPGQDAGRVGSGNLASGSVASGNVASRNVASRNVASGNSVRLTGASMRLLESGLAFIAFATAILIGLGR